MPRSAFTRASGGEDKRMCNPCYYQALDEEEDPHSRDENDDDHYSRHSSTSSFYPHYRDSSVSDFSVGNMNMDSRGNPPSPAPGARQLDTTDPPIDYHRRNNDPDSPVLSE